jgi:hypothetical protein
MAETPAKPRRRFLRFSLRTMLLLVVVIALPLGYAARQIGIVAERNRVLETLTSQRARVKFADFAHGPRFEPPWPLRWFSEAYGVIFIELRPGEFSAAERARIEWLFPEAMVASDQAFFDWEDCLMRREPGEPLPKRPQLEVFEYYRRLASDE